MTGNVTGYFYTMKRADDESTSKARVARHRTKAAANGSQRVEVTVPARDAELVKAIAGALRSGGEDANRLRETLQPMVSAKRAQTGAELVAFFRASPLVGANLTLERDKSPGRTIDFE